MAKNTLIRLIYTILIAVTLSGCEDDSYPVLLETDQVERLIGGEKAKTWYLETEIACEEDNASTFTRAIHADSVAVYTVKKGDILCPGKLGEDIIGSWEVFQSGNINHLNIFAEDTVRYEITLLTASQMRLKVEEEELRYFSTLVVD